MSIKRGREAETEALKHMRQQGLRLVESNYSTRFGEIDLIMLDDETLVFVEVRYRKQDRFGSALESVDWKKRDRLIKTAHCFLQKNHDHVTRPCRFDVIGLGRDQGKIDWIQNAFGL